MGINLLGKDKGKKNTFENISESFFPPGLPSLEGDFSDTTSQASGRFLLAKPSLVYCYSSYLFYAFRLFEIAIRKSVLMHNVYCNCIHSD